MLKNVELKIEVPGLDRLAHDAAYRAGAQDVGRPAAAVGFVLGLILAFALVAAFRRKLP